MENESESPYERFIAVAKKYADMWNTIEVAVVAIKEDDNAYNPLGINATFLADATPVSEILLDLEDLVMLHEVRPITHTELDHMIRDLERSVIKIGEIELRLRGFDRFDFGRSSGHRRGHLDVDWEWPYFWLGSIGSRALGDVINEQEIDAKLNKWGYENLWSASKEKLGFEVGGAHSPHIYLVSPIYLIADAHIKEDKLIFFVKCHKSISMEDIVISYGTEGDTPKHDRLSFGSDDIFSRRGNFSELQKVVDLPPDTRSARFWTSYKDQEIDEYWIHKPIERTEEINPKWIVIQPLFSKSERGELIGGERIFERCLGVEAEVSDSNVFELGILNLMSIAGFHIVFTGKRFDFKGIDMLAFSPDSPDVIAISCTIANDIREKMRTLLPQSNAMKRQLEDYDLISAIFSPVNPEDVIVSDRKDAKDHKVALLLSHEIREIYQKVQTIPVSEIREIVLNYIMNKIAEA